jgi:hypothetical protein
MAREELPLVKTLSEQYPYHKVSDHKSEREKATISLLPTRSLAGREIF